MPQSEDAAAVGERLVDGEVETVVALLHLRAVERTRAALGADPPAARALPGVPVDALLEQEQLHARVGGRLQGVGPAGRRPRPTPRLLAPALRRLALLLGMPLLEDRPRRFEQLGWSRVRLGLRPADDRVAHLVRDDVIEIGAILVGCSDDDARALKPAHEAVEHLGDPPEMVEGELLDVTLVPRLRPAALVVAARRLIHLACPLLAPAAAELVDVAALTADESDEGAVAAPHERDQRGEVELARDCNLVGHGICQRQGPPGVVEAGAENGDTARSLPVELILEVRTQPSQV